MLQRYRSGTTLQSGRGCPAPHCAVIEVEYTHTYELGAAASAAPAAVHRQRHHVALDRMGRRHLRHDHFYAAVIASCTAFAERSPSRNTPRIPFALKQKCGVSVVSVPLGRTDNLSGLAQFNTVPRP
jgi:hypothetical protein